MKFSEVKELSVDELSKKVRTLKEEMFESKMKHTLGQLSNTDSIRQARRNLARLRTALKMASEKQ